MKSKRVIAKWFANQLDIKEEKDKYLRGEYKRNDKVHVKCPICGNIAYVEIAS